jgi:hypothetical protein
MKIYTLQPVMMDIIIPRMHTVQTPSEPAVPMFLVSLFANDRGDSVKRLNEFERNAMWAASN